VFFSCKLIKDKVKITIKDKYVWITTEDVCGV